MKKAHRSVLAFVLSALLFATSLSIFTACNSGGGESANDYYTVTYDLNYDGAANRTYTVQNGVKIHNWKATRDGYRLTGWYTDKAATEEFDFTKKADSDVTLYAGWRLRPGMTTVTFDFGYDGAADKVITIEKESLINPKYQPSAKRFGMELVGWYKDEALTNKWNFDADAVMEETVLHAKFEYTMNIPRNEDGSIAYENTPVYLWNSAGRFPSAILDRMVKAFNKEHEGKIIVESGTELLIQADVFLRVQQTPEQMRCYTTYYPIADMFTFAGYDISSEEFYKDSVNESKFKDVMLQTPVMAFAPYIVYNKTLMTKYNGNAELPKNYNELSVLLKKAAAGELATNSGFRSILTTTDWMYKEATSYTAFAQNGVDYFKYDGEAYINNWSDPAVMTTVQQSMLKTYDLFGVNGDLKGGSIEGSDVVSVVKTGNALMGLVSWAGSSASVLNDSNLGVLPLAGLFADEGVDEEIASRTPVHTVGIGFYNGATNVLSDALRICASVEFTKYVLEHSYMFAEYGYSPLYKDAINNDEYVNSTNRIVKLAKESCKPENYYTLDGCANIKAIINATAAEGVIVPYLINAKASRNDYLSVTENLYSQVAGMVS